MRFIADLSIRRKLMLMILLSCAAALLLACVAFVMIDGASTRKAMVNKLQIMAEIIGQNAISALEFRDQEAALETLESLKAESHIRTAAIYDAQNNVFVHHHRDLDSAEPPPCEPAGYRIGKGFELFHDVIFQGRRIGAVYIRSDLEELEERQQSYVITALGLLLISGAAALIIGFVLQRWITNPILDLANTTLEVSEKRDYAIRAPEQGRDEIGTLVRGFNDMLAQIQAREVARQKAEAELEAQRTRSVQADRLRSLGEMAAGIAHELNQPLVGVRGLAEHILIGQERGWDLPPEKLKERMTRIIEQADRMVHIIQHVRQFASEAGKSKTEPVNINDVVTSTLSMVSAQFRSHGIAIDTQLTNTISPVMANPYSLEEVLLNLLSNARDAVEERQEKEDGVDGRVTVCTYEDAQYLTVEVIDNGTGIAADIRDRIFDPFFTTKPPDKGTGLGLPICKTIVEDLNGTVSVQSTPGQTTKAIVQLPVAFREGKHA